MLTINAQSRGISVDVFVCDNDGERIFTADPAGMTLAGMEATGSMSDVASQYSNNIAIQQCVKFCGDRDYWISSAVDEAIKQSSDYTLDLMAFGN